MPSYVDPTPIYNDSDADILKLESDYEYPNPKANGAHPAHRIPPAAINEPFDEASNSSIHDSDASGSALDTAPMTAASTTTNTNGNITRATSMNSLPNGKSGRDDEPGLPDRSRLPNGVDGSHAEKPRRSTEQQNKPSLPTIPSEAESLSSQTKSFFPPIASPVGESAAPPRQASPHRLSSPPIYHGSSVNSPSSPSHLQPPHPGAALKQRHTLEVPKIASAKVSKDGGDSAQASGRFSPTVGTNAGSGRRASLSLARRTTRSMQSDAPRDEVVPDEDVARWAEALRQKRASKRRRKEEEDDDRVLVGTKVDETHANWVTAYNMLTGIRVAVSRTNAKLDRDLTDADFDVKQKSTFDVAGNELVPSAKYDFKFKDYAPWVFRHLRSLFRIDPAEYLMSLTGKYILSELGSPGKSGSFFYFSRDYKYIIKTIHHAEHKFLRKILKDYYQHVRDNPNTLLSQFYGLHRVKVPYGKKIHFVVMNNLFPPHRDIHTTFDLKGSTIGRDYREDDLDKNPRATLKDLNWLRRKRQLELGIQKKRMFLEQLQKDVKLLKKLKIMDYSLLVGIHDLSRGNEENLRDKTLQVFNPGGEKDRGDEPPSVLLRTPSKLENARKARELRQMIRSERPVPIGQVLEKDQLEGQARPGFVFNQDDGGFQATHEDNTPADEVYYLGVIDCLTHISALPPDLYGDRFYNFIEGNTMSTEEAHREAQRKDAEMIQASRTSQSKRHHTIPPMPDHLPPAPPPDRTMSPEGREVLEMASVQAHRTEQAGASERHVPDRTLRTSAGQRDSQQGEAILPVVEEAGDDDMRPRTPAKDKMLPPTRAPPPTPPKANNTSKAESSDSGYGGQPRLSKESLRNKTLPPLPTEPGRTTA
ncbi:Phosphatidylinositol 4-phosphate 5-kinase-like protein [Emericellopsis cladophorae]|uniref:1-phosphatidylinositol-4-phosphate 5-kinase n=1 Tax=Emericellopsis cladophorae TaxID=2686198 RepID=A0A9P9Y0A2_9HYPO|nr:Phosphatidylinositol 4-phosphate 5-kinase-like protein [Emericellopsis cladophorae]KAI6780768.1 Phosphatidylinositol 4-phosphate 5-kinase-like protein [Emericellopsis cladophorae]